MLSITHSSCLEPHCLSEARRKGKKYSQLTVEERREVKSSLYKMQNGLCAYCEDITDEDVGHNEHFKKQSLFNSDTLTWSNLYFSCNNESHCGKQKDKFVGQSRDKNLKLISPADNPTDFFLFLSDGSVVLRDGLSDSDLERAEKTYEAFQFNHAGIKAKRENFIKQWMAVYKLISEAFPYESFLQLLNNSDKRFPSLVKDVFVKPKVD